MNLICPNVCRYENPCVKVGSVSDFSVDNHRYYCSNCYGYFSALFVLQGLAVRDLAFAKKRLKAEAAQHAAGRKRSAAAAGCAAAAQKEHPTSNTGVNKK